MGQLSPRLIQRIEADFPHHAAVVTGRLATLCDVFDGAEQGDERILAAVIRVAAGRLDRLEQAIDLARGDWRDLLTAADLADEAWPARVLRRG